MPQPVDPADLPMAATQPTDASEAGPVRPSETGWDRLRTAAQALQPSGAAPAAAGTHPDTPDRAAGVLGRTLLDRDGCLWQWRAGDLWGRGGSSAGVRSRIELEGEHGPVREVLLVSPAAGRVLDAARVVAALDTLGDYRDWRRVAALHRELREAVDAYDRPTTRSGDGGRAAYERELARLRAGGEPDPAERDQALREALREDAEMDALQRDEDAAVPAPEPDSGPGWNRVWLLDCMVTSLPGASYNEPDLHDEARRQVLALLADRDRLERELQDALSSSYAEQVRLVRQRDAARAELAETRRYVERAVAANEELARVAADLTRVEEALAGARRDAAADALQMAGAKLAMQHHHTCADVVRGLAGEIRAGTRPVPGSPQPASDGGQDG